MRQFNFETGNPSMIRHLLLARFAFGDCLYFFGNDLDK